MQAAGRVTRYCLIVTLACTAVVGLGGCAPQEERGDQQTSDGGVRPATNSRASADDLFDLANRYATGDGVPRDDTKAVQLLSTAADMGNPDAAVLLGRWYMIGRGVSRDVPLGIEWVTRGATVGGPDHQLSAATTFLDGTYIPRDCERATKWLTAAAQADAASALMVLGDLYLNGTCVEANDSRAFLYIERAAKLGHQSARIELAGFYCRGRAVPKNETLCYAWALASGLDYDLALVREGMSEAELVEAEELAQSFSDDVPAGAP